MSEFFYYLQFDFVIYALIVGVLIALCSSLLGVTLVLKRYSFIGDGLSHVAFGAMAIATVLKITSNTILVMPVTIIVAVLLLRNGNKSMLKGDAAIAMLSVTSLAFGYLIMNVFSSSANISGDVCSTLFGSTSILTLDIKEVIICIVLSIIVIGLYILFYNKIFAVTFDETFCSATGVPAGRYNFLIAVIIAVIIVLGMNLVGSLLISALIVFPALAAMRLSGTFKGVVILSVIFSVVCALTGMFISIVYSTPVGATIVAADLICFIVCYIIEKLHVGAAGVGKVSATAAMILMCLMLTGCGDSVTASKNAPQNNVKDIIDSQIEKEQNSEDSIQNAEVNDEKNDQNVELDNENNNQSTELSDENNDQYAEPGNENDDLKKEDDEKEVEQAQISSPSNAEGIDIDLTTMSSDMVYATVYQILGESDSYVGKKIKMSGTYYSSWYEDTQQYYYFVLIKDATACCQQGLEFIWGDGSHVYPDEYPPENSEVEVVGTFETYKDNPDDQYTYARLSNATLKVISEPEETVKE